MMLGDIEVTALSDGTFPMPVDKMLTHVKPDELDAALKHAILKEPVETSVNGFLVNTGAKLVLIDTGSGILSGPASASCSRTSRRRAIGRSKWTRSTSPTCTVTTSAAWCWTESPPFPMPSCGHLSKKPTFG